MPFLVARRRPDGISSAAEASLRRIDMARLTDLSAAPNSAGTADRSMTRLPPILAGKDFAAPSVFEPENLLREARRQRNVSDAAVPEICALDPDGDIVRRLTETGRARRSPGWACYH